MDWLEFVQKSEWPLVVSGGLLLFRKSISELLRGMRPKKFKGFGIDAEFETGLQKAEVLTADIPPVALPAPGEPASNASSAVATEAVAPVALDEELPKEASKQQEEALKPRPRVAMRPMGSLLPDARVILAYDALEAKLQNYFLASKPKMAADYRRRDIEFVGRTIGFDDDEIAALNEIRSLRNKIAHRTGRPVSEAEANRFEAVARRLDRRAFHLYVEKQAELSRTGHGAHPLPRPK